MPVPIPPFYPERKVENTRAHIMLSIMTLGAWAPIWALMRWRISSQNKKAEIEYRFARNQYEQDIRRYQ